MTITDLARMSVHRYDKYHGVDELQDIAGHVMSQFREFKNARTRIERQWLSSWSDYIVSEEATRYNRMEMLREIGNVNTKWRHNVDTGKGFEVVETVHPYLMGSLFPNSNWFDVKETQPGYRKLARVLKYYIREKLYDWRFMSEFATYLRQMLVTGTSVMSLPWADKSGRIEFECLDVFDVYWNPAEVRWDNSPIIRKIRKTRSMIIEDIERGFYSNIEPLDVVKTRPRAVGSGMIDEDMEYSTEQAQLRRFRGVDVPPYSMSDKLTVVEFWGDVTMPHATIKNAVATVVCGKLVRLVPNTYKCGVPFVVGTFLPVPRQIHGIGLLQPSGGLIKAFNNATNQMLDGVELAVNPMYTLKRDSVLRAEDIITEPGAVYEVEEHDALRPVPPPQNNFNLSFMELQALESTVDKNSGTGPLLGGAQPRGGERVTAQEIQAVREAGGNRLLGYHKHIEQDSLLAIMQKLILIVKQFTRVDETIIVPNLETGTEEFVDVGPQELQYDYKVRPRGADHVIEESEYVRKRLEFIASVAEIPGVLEMLNMRKIVEDILQHWGFEDPDVYMNQPDSPVSNAIQAPQDPMAMLGGPAATRAIQQEMLADGGRGTFERSYGQQLPEGMSLEDVAAAAQMIQ